MPDDYILRSEAVKALTLERLNRNLDTVQDGEKNRYLRAAERVIVSLPAAAVEPKQKWIPVTERLPENDTIVLVISQLYHDHPYPAFQIDGVWYDGYLVACQAVEDMGDEWTIDDSGITHWMPLPEPPKEGEDDI